MSDLVGPICFKACTACGSHKTLEHFSRQAACKFARRPVCKVCDARKAGGWRAENPAKVKASSAAWAAANPAKAKAAQAAWRKANVDKVKQGVSNYRKANLEELKVKAAARYAANKAAQKAKSDSLTPEERDQAKLKAKADYQNNKVAIAEYKRAWRQGRLEAVRAREKANLAARMEKPEARKAAAERDQRKYQRRRAAIIEQKKAYRALYPDKIAAHSLKRRASSRQARPLWAALARITDICRSAQQEGLAVDHIYPLRGKTVSGLHVPENLRPLGQSANSRKGNKLPGFLAHELWDPTGPGVLHE